MEGIENCNTTGKSVLSGGPTTTAQSETGVHVESHVWWCSRVIQDVRLVQDPQPVTEAHEVRFCSFSRNILLLIMKDKGHLVPHAYLTDLVGKQLDILTHTKFEKLYLSVYLFAVTNPISNMLMLNWKKGSLHLKVWFSKGYIISYIVFIVGDRLIDR